MVSDEMIEYISNLAKLELSEDEKQQAKQDMDKMLAYIDHLKELDTTGVEAMSHVFSQGNVFREDVVRNRNNREAVLENAPSVEKGAYKVPQTIE